MTITSISFDITYKCNLRCRHCFNSSGEHNYERLMLSDEEILDIVNQLKHLDTVKNICFCGGETLIKEKALFESAKIFSDSIPKAYINFVTNGMLIDKYIIDKIKSSGIHMVQISIDGYDEETHNYIRCNKEAYRKAIKAIKLLVKNNINVSVATLPTKKTVYNIKEHIKNLENLGVKDFRMQPLMLLGRAREGMEEIMLSDIDYIRLAKFLEKETLNRAGTNKMQVEWGDPIMHLSSFLDKKLSYLYINAYGQIMISPYLPIVIGDLRKHDFSYYIKNGLEDIWKNPAVKNLALRVKSSKMMDVFKDDGKEIFEENDYIIEL